jgi:Domain of unknown function (DUF6484)
MVMSAAEIDIIADAKERKRLRQTDISKAGGNATVIGTLLGFREDGRIPLVQFPGQSGTAAVAARATVDLCGSNIGGSVVLVFAEGDLRQPLIVGILRTERGWPPAEQPGTVEVDADGERLIVNAKEQLVLRCGKASITLTKAGKILVEGTYVSNRSSGVMRIKGGSVQIN